MTLANPQSPPYTPSIQKDRKFDQTDSALMREVVSWADQGFQPADISKTLLLPRPALEKAWPVIINGVRELRLQRVRDARRQSDDL